MISLRKMKNEEYPAYCDYFIEDYSNEIVLNYGHSIEVATELAKKDLTECFPNGLDTNKHDLLCIEVEIADSFDISEPVLQREKKNISNTIKLDTNIQLKMNFNDTESIHQFVEQGYDDTKGMHFYKVFYNREIK